MTNYVAVVAVILIVTLVFGIGWILRGFVARVRQLEQQVSRLEDAQRTRNTWRTNDGLEDAMSVSWDVIQRAAETLDYVQRRTEQTKRILQVIRSKPDHYDSDEPNKKKVMR